jgi:hypothetical protein
MTATGQSDRSPAPGIIPERAYVHHNDAPAARRHGAHAPSRNLVRVALTKLASALRGDKYMVDAYPDARAEELGTRVRADMNTGER